MSASQKKFVMGVALLLIAFCLAFLSTYFFIIKPQYRYISREKIYEQIKDLKEQLSEREQKIVQLEQELEVYRSINKARAT